MAKVVNNFDFPRPRTRFPVEWLDGSTRSFTKGEDYENPKSFVHSLRQKAKNAGLRSNASVQENGTLVYFRAYKPGEDKVAAPAPSTGTKKTATKRKKAS